MSSRFTSFTALVGKHPIFSMGLLLTVVLAVVFGEVAKFQFLYYDDQEFITGNPWFQKPFTLETLQWALTAQLTEFSPYAEYWSPLTLLTRCFDASVHTLDHPGGHHITSLFIHGANALALFSALWIMTGSRGKSAVVSLLFALSPQNIEAVAWLSARKDLVAAFFFLLTICAYARWVQKPGAKAYTLVLLAFLGAIMSKPMVASTPFVLLLLDFWPLKRVDTFSFRAMMRLFLEKWPFIVLSIFSALLAIICQRQFGAVVKLEDCSLWARVSNAIVSVPTYFRRVFWPSDLSIFYPHMRDQIPLWQVGVAALAIGVLLFIAIRCARNAPWVTVGLGWFAVVIAPVSGLIQLGSSAMADRYAYPSTIGVLIAVVWQVAHWIDRVPALDKVSPHTLRALTAGTAIGVAAMATWAHLPMWANTVTIFSQADRVTPPSHEVQSVLGNVLMLANRPKEALKHYAVAMRLRPEPSLFNRYGSASVETGDLTTAQKVFRASLSLKPDQPEVTFYLGMVSLWQNDPAAAERSFRETLRLDPTFHLAISELDKLLKSQSPPAPSK